MPCPSGGQDERRILHAGAVPDALKAESFGAISRRRREHGRLNPPGLHRRYRLRVAAGLYQWHVFHSLHVVLSEAHLRHVRRARSQAGHGHSFAFEIFDSGDPRNHIQTDRRRIGNKSGKREVRAAKNSAHDRIGAAINEIDFSRDQRADRHRRAADVDEIGVDLIFLIEALISGNPYGRKDTAD